MFVSERGLTSTQWMEYSENTKRIQYSAVPTSDITAEAVTVDGFVLSQKDTAGVVTTTTRSYTASGMLLTQTDGRGKATPKNESDFEASMEFGSESLTETNISDMFEGIKFCSPCHIELRVCHIGKSQKLANSLKEKYPCTITMYDTYVKP